MLLRLILVASKTKGIVLQAHINWKKSFKTDYIEVVLEADRCCVNECEAGTADCHDNAYCTNIVGSYNCTCQPGYTGNGTTCTGVLFLYLAHQPSNPKNKPK